MATTAERRSVVLGFLDALFTIETLYALGALALVLFVVGAIMWGFERKRNPDQFGGTASRGLGSGFWWSAVTMTTVGYGDKAPISFAGRVVGLIWMFASIILISGFTGAIASALTVSNLAPTIERFEDLYRARVGVVAESNALDYLRGRGITARTFENTEAGLSAVANGEIDGFVNDAPLLRYYVGREFAERLFVLPKGFEPGFYAFGLSEGFDRREAVNQALLEVLKSSRWEEITRRHLGE